MMDTSYGARFLGVFLFSGEDFAVDGEECSSQGWIMMAVMVQLVLTWLVVLLWRVLMSVVGEEVVWTLGVGVGGKCDQSESDDQRAQRCECTR